MSSITPPIPAPPVPVVEGRIRRVVPPRRERNWAWLIILALMLLSSILRFASMDVPPIWGDEAAVAWRTCGTYREMTDVLRNDGFVPLHYSFFWVVRQFTPLTPFVLRIVPTIASILMIPAMYFLARQLVSKRTALTVAAFTAFSSHLGWHAQDAKMYSHFWLMCVLCMGSFLWWLRAGGGLAFWCWMASGVCMVGLHSLGWGIIGLQPLFMIFRGKPAGRSWWWVARGYLVFIVGMCIIGAGPATYYLGFNVWTQNIQDRGWDASGISWIKIWFTPDILVLMRDTTNHFLFGYDFPPPDFSGVSPWQWWQYVVVIPVALAGLLAICLFPYPTRARGRDTSPLPIAWWRTTLVLAAWVLLPPYGFYCASIDGYAWPHEAVGALLALIWQTPQAMALLAVIGLLAFYFCAPTWLGRAKRLAGLVVIGAAILLAATAIAWCLRHRPPGPLWVSRYLGFVWPGFVIAVFALLGRLPIPPVRWLVVGALIAIDLYIGIARVVWRQDAPVDLLARDFVTAQEKDSTTRAYAIGMSPREKLSDLTGHYYLFLYSGRKTPPWLFAGMNVGGVYKLPEGTVTDEIYKSFVASPETQRIIVWQQVSMSGGPRAVPPIPRDKLLARLPTGWRCASENLYPFTARWGWGEFKGCWSRREFVASTAAK